MLQAGTWCVRMSRGHLQMSLKVTITKTDYYMLYYDIYCTGLKVVGKWPYRNAVLYDLGVQYGPFRVVKEHCQLNTHRSHMLYQKLFSNMGMASNVWSNVIIPPLAVACTCSSGTNKAHFLKLISPESNGVFHFQVCLESDILPYHSHPNQTTLYIMH